jgi:hypothetical protein
MGKCRGRCWSLGWYICIGYVGRDRGSDSYGVGLE